MLLRDFASSWNKLLKHCISADFSLIERKVQGALRKELRIALFLELLKMLLCESLIYKIYQYLEYLFKHYISAEFLLIEG